MSSFDYARVRETMVEQQIRPWDVLDERVLEVLASLPRHAFVSDARRDLAYADLELPIGHGEVMLKPVVEARILQALALRPGDAVLEVGAGSGWFAACLGALAGEVLSLDRHADFVEAARARLDAAGLGGNVALEAADAFAWETDRRFDAIGLSGAGAELPERFLRWRRPGGRLCAVRGRAPAMEAVLVRADGVNAPRVESLFETEIPYLAGAEPVPEFRL